MCVVIVSLPGCDVMNFKISLIFLISRFFYMTKKSKQKFRYLAREKELLR